MKILHIVTLNSKLLHFGQELQFDRGGSFDELIKRGPFGFNSDFLFAQNWEKSLHFIAHLPLLNRLTWTNEFSPNCTFFYIIYAYLRLPLPNRIALFRPYLVPLRQDELHDYRRPPQKFRRIYKKELPGSKVNEEHSHH